MAGQIPKNPSIGFVSLGWPRALVHSERILTGLRADGYGITANEAVIRNRHPKVLNITGPQQYEQVVSAVHRHLPLASKHDPCVDLVPETGIKLTPRYFAYLKTSEGCKHKCRLYISPDLRGKPVSRSAGEVLRAAAENTLECIASWRAECPELALRSTFIVGFPAETEADFQDLPKFLEHARLQEKVGSQLGVLVEEVNENGTIARSQAHAPGMNGVVEFIDGQQLIPHEPVQTKLIAADDCDLSATVMA